LSPQEDQASIVSPHTLLVHVAVRHWGAVHWDGLVHATHVPFEQYGNVGLSRAQSLFVVQPVHAPAEQTPAREPIRQSKPSIAFAGAHVPVAEQPFTLHWPGSVSQSAGTRHATHCPLLHTSEPLHTEPSTAFVGAHMFAAEQPFTLQIPGSAAQSDGDTHPTHPPSLHTPALHALPFDAFCGSHAPFAKLQ
jgi:hypothetical protein